LNLPTPEERNLALAEESVVRYGQAHPGQLSVSDESTLRQTFALARLSLEDEARPRRTLDEFRRLALATAHALFGDAGGAPEPGPEPRPELLAAAASRLWELTLAARDGTGDPKAWEAELRQRRLVLALGGGGGVGYVYLGCFALLDQWGLTPTLIAGTSFGAVLGLFRAQRASFHAQDTAETLAGLSLTKLFRLFRVRSQYALPGPLQLYLRSALLPALKTPTPPRLSDLAIPLVVAVAGVRKGMLPRPPREYERLLDPRSFFPPTPGRLRGRVQDLFSVLGEFVRQPHRLDALIMGADPGTERFDALDAIGFSCSLPGFIHYDVVRDDPLAHHHIRRLFEHRELGWLADGGLVENCPARAARLGFRAGSRGAPRNGFVLALDAFSPKLSIAPFIGLQRLAQETTRRVLPYADCYVPFPRTLSPLSILPDRDQIARAASYGRAQLSPLMPFLAKMLTPLPALEACRPA
jgi:hypothetical protein